MKATRATAIKILDIMSHGLCRDVGKPAPGEMCILAVKRYVFGLSHGDELEGLPIGSAVRSFDIALNDCGWSSNQARAKGMSRLAVAEFGSDQINQNLFVKELVLATVRKIIPIALRVAAKIHSDKLHQLALEKNAVACESVSDLVAARAAASDAARAASYASYAASYASYAARAASYASDAVRAASDAASDASYASDEVLSIMAECGVQALIACKSYGCEWLDLVRA